MLSPPAGAHLQAGAVICATLNSGRQERHHV